MGTDWNPGPVAHLIPTANHERILIKASFKTALRDTPRLSIAGRLTEGERTDPEGRFWRFDTDGLASDTTHELRLSDAHGTWLCDPWPLKTLPAPDASPERVRILTYTCGGGYDGPAFHGKSWFLDMAARRQLLARGLSFAPDVVIANGDHIYWDQKTSLNKGADLAQYTRQEVWTRFGSPLDLSVPMLHPRNLATFVSVCDYQIAGLYGTALRSTPAWFLTDDHDNFENDEFDPFIATQPPDRYGTLGAEQTQHLYYPEFLPDDQQPAWLPGSNLGSAPRGVNVCFGTLRYGKLLETVLYDCRRYLDQKGEHAKLVPQWVEDWLLARTLSQDTAHLLHCPSLPFAYSSGKLGDWYPDMLDEEVGKLVLYRSKIGWQSGWLAQHQRLMEAMSARSKRPSVIIQGDFHASAVGTMERSGELRFDQPVHVVTIGTLGSGDMAFPSAFRKMESTPSQLVHMDQLLKPVEMNGFTIIDVTPKSIAFRLFMWRPPQPLEAIHSMPPAYEYRVERAV